MVDPGDEAEKIIKTLSLIRKQKPELEIQALFHTHAHLDHIGATREVKEALLQFQKKTIPQIYLHREDEFIYQQLQMQGQMFGLNYAPPLPIDQYFEDEQQLSVGQFKFEIIHTPGHSPGGVCIRLYEDSALDAQETVFSGDTLFQGSVGRTDLWGADQDQLFKSIKERLFTLDQDTRLCPGHGPDSIVGIEKRENPFFR